MGFTFRDLAGSTMDDQGLAFGVIAEFCLLLFYQVTETVLDNYCE